MATTKVIKDLTEFNPGNPDYVLNATNAVTVINSGGNQYNFNGVYGKFGLRIGTTVLTGVPSGHPIAVLNNGLTGITYTGTVNEGTLAVGGVTYTFYSGDVTITVTADFGVASYYCKIHGYMGGQDNLVSVYSEAGLRMPTGGAFSGAPAEGMMRNDTTQASEGSASTMQHYTGDNVWKNFVNVNNCTTSTLNYPTGVTGTALYELDSTADSTSSSSFNATSTPNLTYSTSIKKYGTASAVFNGTSSGINLPLNSFNFSAFTISAWVYITSNPSSGQVYNIMSTYDYQNGPSKGWTFGITDAGKLRFSGHSGDCSQPYPADPSCNLYTRIQSSSSIPLSTWTFVAVTNAGTGSAVTLYIGTTNEATTTMQGLAYYSQNPTIGYGTYAVGGTNYTDGFFSGNIDQVRVYNSALSFTNISSLNNEVGC